MKLICYLSNGYPTIESSIEMAQRYVEAGCDIIEVDFPAHDPYLESPFLQDRMRVALENCSDYTKYMEGMAEIKRLLPDTDIILLSYKETLLEIGYDNFIEFCRENNFKDLIFVGDDSGEITEKLIADGILVSCYVQYHLDPKEVKLAKNSNGFVYMQAKPSTDKINPDYPTLADCISYLRKQGIIRPIYCGVGIHTPEDVKMAKDAGADGVFVGSTILKLQDDLPALTQTISDFKSQC